jgi:hypothetical protein
MERVFLPQVNHSIKGKGVLSSPIPVAEPRGPFGGLLGPKLRKSFENFVDTVTGAERKQAAAIGQGIRDIVGGGVGGSVNDIGMGLTNSLNNGTKGFATLGASVVIPIAIAVGLIAIAVIVK